MKRLSDIWFFLFMAVTFSFIACSTVGKAPLDDAYYWEKETDPAAETSPSREARPSHVADTSAQAGPSIHYINIQDTTVTVRIKR